MRRTARQRATVLPCQRPKSPYTLTVRERENMELVLGGTSTRTMAERLCISVNTCQDHLKVILDKGGVRSRHELAAVSR